MGETEASRDLDGVGGADVEDLLGRGDSEVPPCDQRHAAGLSELREVLALGLEHLAVVVRGPQVGEDGVGFVVGDDFLDVRVGHDPVLAVDGDAVDAAFDGVRPQAVEVAVDDTGLEGRVVGPRTQEQETSSHRWHGREHCSRKDRKTGESNQRSSIEESRRLPARWRSSAMPKMQG